MKTPYELLSVAVEATDAEIKQAYLQKVKEYPPDRDQEQFQLLHEAYQTIKDSNARLSYSLFTIPTVNFDDLLAAAFPEPASQPITAAQFNGLLDACIDGQTFLNALPSTNKA